MSKIEQLFKEYLSEKKDVEKAHKTWKAKPSDAHFATYKEALVNAEKAFKRFKTQLDQHPGAGIRVEGNRLIIPAATRAHFRRSAKK